MNQILGFTGHRPKSLPGKYSEQTYQALLDTADFVLFQYRPDAVISGMALGWDTAIAEVAVRQGIDLIAAVPFQGQESQWPIASRNKYLYLLSRARHAEIVTTKGYNSYAMQLRNEWIVNHCHQLVALWHRGSGGTANCVDYAIRTNRPCWNVWDTFMHFYQV